MRKRGRTGVRSRVLATLFFFFAVSVAVFYVWERITAVELTMRIQRLRDELLRVENETKRLEIEKSKLSSRRRIERIARKRIGMVYPMSRDIVVVTPDLRCIRLGERR
ncbi:MAG: cell division protein FtsL [bacterium]